MGGPLRASLRFLAPAIIVLLAVTSAGCGSTAAPAKGPAASTASAPASSAPSSSAPASSPPASTAPAAPKLTPVTIAVPVASEAFTDIYVARDLGIFQKHGLKVTIETMKMPTALAGLTTGSVTFEAGAGSGVRASETGLPLKTIYVAMDHPPFLVVSGKDITSVSQLKGKTIAMKTALEAITAVGQAWLATQGLPVGSYKYIASASTPEEVALLAKGTVQAAVLELATGLPLAAKGYHILGSTLSITIPLSGLTTGDSQIKAHPQVMREAVASALDAVKLIQSNESAVLPVIEKDFHDKPVYAKQVYNDIKDAFTTSGKPSAATIQRGFTMDRKALTLAHAKFTWPFNQSQIYDWQFLPQGS